MDLENILSFSHIIFQSLQPQGCKGLQNGQELSGHLSIEQNHL